jgi:hypothetical protein
MGEWNKEFDEYLEFRNKVVEVVSELGLWFQKDVEDVESSKCSRS